MTKSSEHSLAGKFRFDAESGELRNSSGNSTTLRPQTSNVLKCLLSRQGEIVTKDELMEEVWQGISVTDDSLVQCISEIRKALGPDSSKILKTIPKHGYSLLATSPQKLLPASSIGRHWRIVMLVAALALILLAISELVLDLHGSRDRVRPKIAVLPFVNMNEDDTTNYFSEGLSEDLLTDLSKIAAISVFSRTSSFSYRDSSKSLRTIAEELGADYLVNGSVRRDGDRIRINVELVGAATDTSLWVERYDRQLGQVFELQDELRAKIVSALAIRLTPEDEKKFFARGTSAIAAYDMLLKGRHEESAMSREGIIKAISFYEKAKAIDPNYGDAYARLANMYDFVGRFGWGEHANRDRLLALNMAETAIRLDPQNPFAHWTYGRVLARWETDSAESRQKAFEELKQAIQLDPNYADAYAFISQLYIGSGRSKYAREAMDKAIGLNPNYPSWYPFTSGIINYMDGDFDRAISEFEKSIEMNPTAPFTRLWLAAAYARAGRKEDAQWQVEEAGAIGSPKTISAVLATNPIVQYPDYVESYVMGLRLAGLAD